MGDVEPECLTFDIAGQPVSAAQEVGLESVSEDVESFDAGRVRSVSAS
jgi:hypothetical protein